MGHNSPAEQANTLQHHMDDQKKSASSQSQGQQQPVAPPAELSGCLTLVKGSSDEERFAGLLLLVKYLNSQKAQQWLCRAQQAAAVTATAAAGMHQPTEADSFDVRRQVLDAVKLDFLMRLFSTPNPSPSPPPAPPMDTTSPPPPPSASAPAESAGHPGVSSFQAVALTITACLAQDPSLVPRLTPVTKYLMSILDILQEALSVGGGGGKEESEPLLADAFFCLYSFATHDPAGAAVALEREDVILRVGQCLGRLHDDQASSSTSSASPSTSELVKQACMALHEVVTLEGRQQVWLGDGRALGVLVELMEKDSTEMKLALVGMVAHMLATRRRAKVMAHHQTAASLLASLPVDFGRKLRSALMQLLHGGLVESYRDSALAILVHGMALLGQGWAVEGEGEEGSGQGGGVVLPVGTSVAFFVHVLAMEVRMASEELEAIGRLEGPEEGEEAVNVMQVEKRRSRALAVLPLCLDGMQTVVRFLCNADGPGAEGEEMEEEEEDEEGTCGGGALWEDVPGEVLLRIRTSLQEVVRALSSLFKYVGWRGSEGSSDSSPSEGMRQVLTEAAMFLSILLAEDDGSMMSTAQVLEALPTIMALLGDERDPSMLLPWVSRALASEVGNEAVPVGVPALVDLNVHHHLINTLMTPEPQQIHSDSMLVLHEMLTRGAALPCLDCDCLLANHPRVLQLLPYLTKAASRAAVSPVVGGATNMQTTSEENHLFRVKQYCVWFALSIMDQFPQSEVEKVLPTGGADYQAFVEAVVQVLLFGGPAQRGGEVVEDEEDELAMLWSRTVLLVQGASEDMRTALVRTAAADKQLGGPMAAQTVEQLLARRGT